MPYDARHTSPVMFLYGWRSGAGRPLDCAESLTEEEMEESEEEKADGKQAEAMLDKATDKAADADMGENVKAGEHEREAEKKYESIQDIDKENKVNFNQNIDNENTTNFQLAVRQDQGELDKEPETCHPTPDQVQPECGHTQEELQPHGVMNPLRSGILAWQQFHPEPGKGQYVQPEYGRGHQIKPEDGKYEQVQLEDGKNQQVHPVSGQLCKFIPIRQVQQERLIQPEPLHGQHVAPYIWTPDEDAPWRQKRRRRLLSACQ